MWRCNLLPGHDGSGLWCVGPGCRKYSGDCRGHAGPAGAIAPMYNYAKGASVTQALNDGADYDEA